MDLKKYIYIYPTNQSFDMNKKMMLVLGPNDIDEDEDGDEDDEDDKDWLHEKRIPIQIDAIRAISDWVLVDIVLRIWYWSRHWGAVVLLKTSRVVWRTETACRHCTEDPDGCHQQRPLTRLTGWVFCLVTNF